MVRYNHMYILKCALGHSLRFFYDNKIIDQTRLALNSRLRPSKQVIFICFLPTSKIP